MHRQAPFYHTYILRVWEERNSQTEQTTWRLTIEDSTTGERQGFETIEALLSCLTQKLKATLEGKQN